MKLLILVLLTILNINSYHFIQNNYITRFTKGLINTYIYYLTIPMHKLANIMHKLANSHVCIFNRVTYIYDKYIGVLVTPKIIKNIHLRGLMRIDKIHIFSLRRTLSTYLENHLYKRHYVAALMHTQKLKNKILSNVLAILEVIVLAAKKSLIILCTTIVMGIMIVAGLVILSIKLLHTTLKRYPYTNSLVGTALSFMGLKCLIKYICYIPPTAKPSTADISPSGLIYARIGGYIQNFRGSAYTLIHMPARGVQRMRANLVNPFTNFNLNFRRQSSPAEDEEFYECEEQ